MQTDFLVIGSGIAGLTYALKVAAEFPDKKILLITKTIADETNTKYAQAALPAFGMKQMTVTKNILKIR
jgi:L-aspartate oxidase